VAVLDEHLNFIVIGDDSFTQEAFKYPIFDAALETTVLSV